MALLVDLWSDDDEDKISDETAILVIDAALRSTSSSAQLVAAELLCRNAERLDACQSLHWPSSGEGDQDKPSRRGRPALDRDSVTSTSRTSSTAHKW
ncbi:hypothetical protein [Streptomyces sp. P17]|uniref:hypothetical protein n=1 Tax=Streptomyces sp. P17 TaxID=3074716 RepID=UPI0028F44E07|nr:hypothetical protein [Streptomyces sp. P17]MDT9700868.1 hypothetical protein [Streptomyces sp. P17]